MSATTFELITGFEARGRLMDSECTISENHHSQIRNQHINKEYSLILASDSWLLFYFSPRGLNTCLLAEGLSRSQSFRFFTASVLLLKSLKKTRSGPVLLLSRVR